MTRKNPTPPTLIIIGSARRLTRATDEGHVNEPGSSIDRWM